MTAGARCAVRPRLAPDRGATAPGPGQKIDRLNECMPWSHWVGVGVRLQPVLHTKAAPGQALPGILRVLKIGQEFNAARDENPAPLWQRDPGLQPQAPCRGAVDEFSRQARG